MLLAHKSLACKQLSYQNKIPIYVYCKLLLFGQFVHHTLEPIVQGKLELHSTGMQV